VTSGRAPFTSFTRLPLAAMGKSQSKLSPEQLSDLQKNTYCSLIYAFVSMI
jgi:hypothetical protein